MLGRSLSAIALLASLSSVEAFWRMPCNKPLIVERADPIVNPGKISGHVHTVSGGSNFDLSSTFETLRESTCTSCLVKQDMSAYWTPQMYFQWANGSFTDVEQTSGGIIYYLQRDNAADVGPVQAFPDGLRMLIGNPFLRSYSGSPMAQAIGWNCLGETENIKTPYLPSTNCPNGLRGELRTSTLGSGHGADLTNSAASFLQSSDHISHMAYPEGDEIGPCPSTHPIRIVTLFYEMMWSVDPWKIVRSQGLNTSQPFVLAMGDPTGYGYHADFFDGWDKTVLQEAIDTCTDDSGVIQLCSVFDLYDDNASCAKTPDVDEQVVGLTLAALPGCNPVTYGPANAVPCAVSTSPAVFSSTTVYTNGIAPPGSATLGNVPKVVTSYKSWTYQDCYSDNVGGVRGLPTLLSTAAKTVEACLDACSAGGFSLCSVEYHGNECYAGNTLASSSTALGYEHCTLTCADNALQYCGGSGPAAMELYKLTGAVSLPYLFYPFKLVFGLDYLIFEHFKLNFDFEPYYYHLDEALRCSTTDSSTTTNTTTTTTSTTTTPASSTVSTSSSSSTTVSAAPSASASASTKLTTSPDWTYSACYSDNMNNVRFLPYTLSNPSSTIESCLEACKSAGYAVCALEYGGGECYAGAALSSASTVLAASKCSMTCNGDSTKTCGGPDALDVYLSTSVAALTQPSTPNFATFGPWNYVNCYSDLVNNVRSLPNQLTNSNLTVEGCLNACTTAGAKVCAVSYGSECFSSKTTISSASTVLPASRCGFPCKGNPLEWCGGSAALSVYNLGSSTLSTRSLPSMAELRAAARLKQKRSKGLFKKEPVL
ncbi:hypothetical protein BCR35DRAFT_349137 [Leucosporidium creatinivorum]|uniref:WSC domain-containing protein n=1 Tax=Leucosporidium creatinivorum TaxID=106004 RepID=A0A1Y2G641_9BASI|nr:hypothetical protein BCR35DRAFT_349137 [Leucosporidium creatinivorum]